MPPDSSGGFPERFGDAYWAEMVAFCALIAGRGPNQVLGSAALEALHVAVAADRFLAIGMRVTVEGLILDA